MPYNDFFFYFKRNYFSEIKILNQTIFSYLTFECKNLILFVRENFICRMENNMITWFVEQKDVDSNFSLKDLKSFSEKFKAKVIIKDFCTFESGVITWLK